MADYNVQVSWSGKDSLSDSDAGKVISGDDFHTEFTAVKTAMDSKADVASETLTGTPLAPTAASGTNTTQIATTAFVTAAFQAMYPVGSIYTNAAVSTNPATLLGFGTWAAYAEGRVPVGKASSGTFDTLNATGGAETDAHTLTTSEIPSHYHESLHGGTSNSSRPSGYTAVSNSLSPYNFGGGTDDDDWGSSQTKATGGGGTHTHDIVQPYIVVYMWKRTA